MLSMGCEVVRGARRFEQGDGDLQDKGRGATATGGGHNNYKQCHPHWPKI
jgi:hypothetical protein